ncbi:hypothetical protein MMA231_02541 [Asticcacaulis sp. MM231]|uniref:hypothetical protein n=1 Tax=Asticcacaulis sp. MM231 TaxID=3157666 RepID=UPI0032D598B7
MAFFWSNIFPALLAGGLAGQLVTVFGGAWLTNRREQKRWLVSERYKIFAELLSIVTAIPKSEEDKSKWTYQIRACSQRLHVLFKEGTAPRDLADALEAVFQFARQRKDNSMPADWSEEQRNSVRSLRQAMSKSLNRD